MFTAEERPMIRFSPLLAAAVLMAGCASEPSKLVTGSLRPAKAPGHATAAVSPEDAKRAACLRRHVQYQRGEAPWGASTPDAIRAGDAYCQNAMAAKP
jgi:hypothetical protein